MMHMVNVAGGPENWTEKHMDSSTVTRSGYICSVVSIRDREEI